jgi:hypothetical protein
MLGDPVSHDVRDVVIEFRVGDGVSDGVVGEPVDGEVGDDVVLDSVGDDVDDEEVVSSDSVRPLINTL